MERIKIEAKIDFRDNELKISGKEIRFRHNISELKENKILFFVRLQIPVSQQISNEDFSNVYAVNKLGKIEWQIQNVPPSDHKDYICAPIVGLTIDKKDELFVTDFMGRRFQVNQKNGELEKVEMVK